MKATIRVAAFAIFLGAGLPVAVHADGAGSTPFTGTPLAIPGTWEAENFNLGGEGVAYHDNTPGNQGGQYRTGEDVDIIVSSDSAGGGYVVNNFETGEWLAYTIDVPTGGNYDIELRASSMLSDSAFHVEINGVNVTGSIPVPNTGSWSAFQWVGKKRISLAAGQHVLKIFTDRQYFNLNSIRVTAAPSGTPTPFTGTPIAVPATFEAEDFDLGGEGVAYHDNVPGNAGGQYRPAEDVDIIVSHDAAGGNYVVNKFETGEWLGYTINVPADGDYDIELRVATRFDFPNSAFHIEIDGVNVTGSVVLPTTNNDANSDWNNFEWLGKRTVSLTAGRHVLKIFTDQQYFNLNSARVLSAAVTPTTTRFEEDAATYGGLATPSGSWTPRGTDIANFSGGSALSSEVAGDTASFSFSGTQVSWIGLKCNICGIATVSIDDGEPSTVNTGNSTPVRSGASSEVVFTSATLAPGDHTMVITVTGTTTSGDAHIAVDAFDVTQ